MKVNKAQLIDRVASGAGVSKAAAGRAIDAMIESISDTLASDDSVTLVGFGTFSVKERSARVGRNPQTGAEIQIAASKSPGFKAGKLLKNALKA